jgi:putative oxidoreductase
MTTTRLDLALLLLRAALGVVFVMHGWQKATVMGHAGVAGFLGSLGVPLPSVSAALLIATELGGGLAILAGAFTRAAAALTASAMLVATALVHWPNGFFLPNGYEFTLTLLLASAALALTGPGAYAVDARLSRPSKAADAPALPRAA